MPLIDPISDEYERRFFRDVEEEFGTSIARSWRDAYAQGEKSADDVLYSVLRDPTLNPAAEFNRLQSRSFLKSECKS